MDFHRVRFIQHPTPTITCYAFSRSQDLDRPSQRDDLRLAIGRSNGSIEIWNPANGAWIQETIFPPSGEDAVDSIVWTQDPDQNGIDGDVIVGQLRLFSIGSSSNVTEWNLATGTVKRKNTGNFGEVWCFAAQPRADLKSKDPPWAQDLAVGCGDGTIALLSTAEDDLQFKRYLARVSGKKARCLTITYQKPQVVVAGFADGTIRVFDTRNGSILRTMSLGVGLPGAPKTTLVWKVVALKSGDIVSADSNGELRMWDGKLYTMMQRVKGHDGDCLELVASRDGKILFSGGVDGRIATYRATIVERGRTSWARLSHRRIRAEHGPVKVLAAYDGATLSVVLTAGSDPAPTVVPLRQFNTENQRALPFLPHSSNLASAPKARLVASWWDATVYIYKFTQTQSQPSPLQQQAYQLVAKINLDTKRDIRAVSISSTGRLLAVSTSTEVKLFQMKSRSPDTEILSIRPVKLPVDFSKLGARAIALSSDEAWLSIVSPDNEVHLARLDRFRDSPKLVQVLDRTVELDISPQTSDDQSSLSAYQRIINKILFSNDDRVLVVSNLGGYVSSWALQGELAPDAPAYGLATPRVPKGADSDSSSDDDDDDEEIAFYGQVWQDNPAPSIPRLDSAVSVLSFRPSAAHYLLAMTARHQIYEFDVNQGRLTDWSRQNPTSSLPDKFTQLRDRVMGSIWDDHGRLWLYGPNFVFMLDVNQPLENGSTEQLVKRKRSEGNIETDRRKKQKGTGAGDRSIPLEFNVAKPESIRKVGGTKAQEVELNVMIEAADEDEGIGYLHSSYDKPMEHDRNVSITSRRTWYTFKYRPILGIVPLRSDVANAEGFEVVIVERPPIESGQSGDKR